jgi:DNA replication protein DnaC
VLYYRVPRLLDALALARGDGRYARLLKSLARVELLILDDWGLAPLTSQQGRDLLEIIDDRHGRGSTILTSQLPVDHWHEVICCATIWMRRGAAIGFEAAAGSAGMIRWPGWAWQAFLSAPSGTAFDCW